MKEKEEKTTNMYTRLVYKHPFKIQAGVLLIIFLMGGYLAGTGVFEISENSEYDFDSDSDISTKYRAMIAGIEVDLLKPLSMVLVHDSLDR